MWMLYSEASRPSAVDVPSAVNRLQQTFRDLGFEASHERVYGLGQYYTDEECNKLERKYNNGFEVCGLFLSGHITKTLLIDLLVALRLEDFLEEVQQFIEKEEEAEDGERV